MFEVLILSCVFLFGLIAGVLLTCLLIDWGRRTGRVELTLRGDD